MKNNKKSDGTKSNDKNSELIYKIKNTKILDYISIIAGIFTIILGISGFWQINFSVSKNQEINNIVHDSELYSEIISKYTKVVQMYTDLINENINNAELKELKNQIDILTTDIANINNEIDKMKLAIEYNNNHDIIASLITGICTIIAALIAGTVAVKVAKIKSN